MKRIQLFDTTLRDGELSPDFNPTAAQRLEIALGLEAAGVDVIELASAADDAERLAASRRIAAQLQSATVCCIARLGETELDISRIFCAGLQRTRIHIYLDSKSIREMPRQPRISDEILRRIERVVGAAADSFAQVEFSPQDATRTDIETLAAVLAPAIAAGAGIVNISDTTGSSTPETIDSLFAQLHDRVPGLGQVLLSLHGHNHLRRAVDNAVVAIDCGVSQIEGTLNGVGPAGGNTDLLALAEILCAANPEGQKLGFELDKLRAVGKLL